MGTSLFTDEEIEAAARGIAERQGADALGREVVRIELARIAAERGVEKYRGDTTRIWQITKKVKKEFERSTSSAARVERLRNGRSSAAWTISSL